MGNACGKGQFGEHAEEEVYAKANGNVHKNKKSGQTNKSSWTWKKNRHKKKKGDQLQVRAQSIEALTANHLYENQGKKTSGMNIKSETKEAETIHKVEIENSAKSLEQILSDDSTKLQEVSLDKSLPSINEESSKSSSQDVNNTTDQNNDIYEIVEPIPISIIDEKRKENLIETKVTEKREENWKVETKIMKFEENTKSEDKNDVRTDSFVFNSNEKETRVISTEQTSSIDQNSDDILNHTKALQDYFKTPSYQADDTPPEQMNEACKAENNGLIFHNNFYEQELDEKLHHKYFQEIINTPVEEKNVSEFLINGTKIEESNASALQSNVFIEYPPEDDDPRDEGEIFEIDDISNNMTHLNVYTNISKALSDIDENAEEEDGQESRKLSSESGSESTDEIIYYSHGTTETSRTEEKVIFTENKAEIKNISVLRSSYLSSLLHSEGNAESIDLSNNQIIDVSLTENDNKEKVKLNTKEIVNKTTTSILQAKSSSNILEKEKGDNINTQQNTVKVEIPPKVQITKNEITTYVLGSGSNTTKQDKSIVSHQVEEQQVKELLPEINNADMKNKITTDVSKIGNKSEKEQENDNNLIQEKVIEKVQTIPEIQITTEEISEKVTTVESEIVKEDVIKEVTFDKNAIISVRDEKVEVNYTSSESNMEQNATINTNIKHQENEAKSTITKQKDSLNEEQRSLDNLKHYENKVTVEKLISPVAGKNILESSSDEKNEADIITSNKKIDAGHTEQNTFTDLKDDKKEVKLTSHEIRDSFNAHQIQIKNIRDEKIDAKITINENLVSSDTQQKDIGNLEEKKNEVIKTTYENNSFVSVDQNPIEKKMKGKKNKLKMTSAEKLNSSDIEQKNIEHLKDETNEDIKTSHEKSTSFNKDQNRIEKIKEKKNKVKITSPKTRGSSKVEKTSLESLEVQNITKRISSSESDFSDARENITEDENKQNIGILSETKINEPKPSQRINSEDTYTLSYTQDREAAKNFSSGTRDGVHSIKEHTELNVKNIQENVSNDIKINIVKKPVVSNSQNNKEIKNMTKTSRIEQTLEKSTAITISEISSTKLGLDQSDDSSKFMDSLTCTSHTHETKTGSKHKKKSQHSSRKPVIVNETVKPTPHQEKTFHASNKISYAAALGGNSNVKTNSAIIAKEVTSFEETHDDIISQEAIGETHDEILNQEAIGETHDEIISQEASGEIHKVTKKVESSHDLNTHKIQPAEVKTQTSDVKIKTPVAAKKHPKVSDKHPEIAYNNPEVTSKLPEVMNKYPEVTNKSREVANKHPEVTNKHPEVTNKYPEVTSNHPEVNSSNKNTEIKTSHVSQVYSVSNKEIKSEKNAEITASASSHTESVKEQNKSHIKNEGIIEKSFPGFSKQGDKVVEEIKVVFPTESPPVSCISYADIVRKSRNK